MFKKQTQFSTGLVPSPVDNRDVLLSSVQPQIARFPKDCPEPFDLTILNQDGNPYCVGYACAALKQYLEAKERNSIVFDGEWIYKKCKEIDGIPNIAGTYFRAGLKVLQKFGAKPLNGKEEDAEKYKIGSYALVDDQSFEGLKKSAFVYGAIISGFIGSNAGWQTAYPRPARAGETTWGHATLLKAYLENYLKGQNSWGIWGENGNFYVPKTYLPFESWVVFTDKPTQEGQEGWVASEFLRNLGIEKGQLVKPTTALRLRTEPMGTILLTLTPSTKLEILKVGEKVSGYLWCKVKLIE